MAAKHEAIDDLAEARERKQGAEYDASRSETLIRSQAEDLASRAGACPDRLAETLHRIVGEFEHDRQQEPPINADLGRTLAEARRRAGLSRVEVAKRIDTFYHVVARLEEGRLADPEWSLLQRYAEATNSRIRLTLEPAD